MVKTTALILTVFAVGVQPICIRTAQSQTSSADSVAAALRLPDDARVRVAQAIAIQRNQAAESQKVKDETEDFKGFGPGVGISLSFYIGDTKPIVGASVVDSVVRVTEEASVATTIMFETHYFFTAGADESWGYGPYVGVLSSTDDVIDALGLGVMVGKRRKASESASFNIGTGVFVDPKVQVLGDGIAENERLPSGETAIRFKTKSAIGWHVMATFQF